MSEEKSEKPNEKRDAYINWATIHLFFLFVVLVESILLLVISTSFYCGIPGLSSLFSGLVGVIVGGLLTFFTSYYLLSLKHLQDLKSIARGFISEFRMYQKNIQRFVDEYSNGSTSVNNNFLQEMDCHIFDNNSLYYALRKEMFKFDEGIVEQLLQLYSFLMYAEEDRRMILHLRKNLPENAPNIIELKTEMLDTLQQANLLIPEIIKDLTFIIDRKI